MISDELFMQRAIELAHLGIGSVSPNPQVGCVIVHNGNIIGEGWHQRHGKAHAEVNAIDSVADKSLLSNSDVFVNLEPCAHFGKTPPCVDLLIKHQVKRVIIANKDPNPLVCGKGIQKLREAKIDVVTGVCEKEGSQLNRRFFTYINKKRPYIILKWAQTSDGFIAQENFDSKWISNEQSRQLVHKWRAEEDAVLVGYNTAAQDNPHLTVRDWTGRNPVRIVIDKQLQLDPSIHLLDQTEKTICYNFIKTEEVSSLTFVRLNSANWMQELLTDLHIRKIQSLIIEGGSKTLIEFIQAGLWDEARVFKADKFFEKGIPAPLLTAKAVGKELIHGDELTVFNSH